MEARAFRRLIQSLVKSSGDDLLRIITAGSPPQRKRGENPSSFGAAQRTWSPTSAVGHFTSFGRGVKAPSAFPPTPAFKCTAHSYSSLAWRAAPRAE